MGKIYLKQLITLENALKVDYLQASWMRWEIVQVYQGGTSYFPASLIR